MEDFGYFKSIVDNMELINKTQEDAIKSAGRLMADAIAADRLINVYGGGGHTIFECCANKHLPW